MAAFRGTRKGAVTGLWIVTTVFFLTAWVFGLYATIANWGWVGVVIGLLLAGVGVALTGLVSSALARTWEPFFIILALSALFFGALWLIQRLTKKIEQGD
jgi:hypothetical protein